MDTTIAVMDRLHDAVGLSKAAVALLENLEHQDDAGRLAGLVEVRRVLRVQQELLLRQVDALDMA